jgi:hypothetical protein
MLSNIILSMVMPYVDEITAGRQRRFWPPAILAVTYIDFEKN